MLALASAGCSHLQPINKEVRSGGSVLIDAGDTSGASLIDINDLTAELTLDNDTSNTVFTAKVVRLFRSFPDPLSTVGRNYSANNAPGNFPPVNDGRWLSVVQLIDPITDVPLDFSSSTITLPSPASLTIKNNGVAGFSTTLDILPGTTTPNPLWNGTDDGLGHQLAYIPHALIKVTGVDGQDFAGAKFVIEYDSNVWTNQQDSVLAPTGKSMIHVTKAVTDRYINLSVNKKVLSPSMKQITILFGNARGFQDFQGGVGTPEYYYYIEDGKSLERDASTVVLSWFKAQGLTLANFPTHMTLTSEIFDINGDIIQGAMANLEPHF